ncbi:hypothetical protein ACIBSV_42195 [Embleya sp. NPDC050154]|uniref:hypothetical protein n=1 Tax=Embleya sp. NPDC050154 TaxID=3363988 RepID=UPI0037BDBBAE
MIDRQTYTFSRADGLLAAAASGDPAVVADIARRDLRFAADGVDAAEVCGVLLRGGGHTPFAEDNPWNVSHDQDLTEMLARIWAPVAAELPEFVGRLSREVMGLVLVRVEGEYRLGYIAFKPSYRSTTRAPSTVTDLPSVAPEGRLHWFWGGPPEELDTVGSGSTAYVLPPPVRTLASVHASLTAPTAEWAMGTGSLDVFVGDSLREQFAQWRETDEDDEDDDTEYAYGDDDFSDYDNYRLLASYEPGMQWSILVPPGADGRCLVSTFDHQDLNVFATAPFWEWFDDIATDILFGSA